jgi:hypothetical protein
MQRKYVQFSIAVNTVLRSVGNLSEIFVATCPDFPDFPGQKVASMNIAPVVPAKSESGTVIALEAA